MITKLWHCASKPNGIDLEVIIISIAKIARIEGGADTLLAVAHLMKEKGMTAFDALHGVPCGSDTIISSDSAFDEVGLRRIKLER